MADVALCRANAVGTPAWPPPRCPLAVAVTPVYSIAVPGSADHLRVLRLFVGGVGRQAGLDDDRVADLKIAVSELAAAAVLAGAETVHLVVEHRDDSLTVTLPASPVTSTDGLDPIEVAGAVLDGTIEVRDGLVRLTVELSRDEDDV
jgi:hypothetical protein